MEELVLARDPCLAELSKSVKLRKKKAKQIKTLIRREKKKRMHQKIGYTLANVSENRGGLARLDIAQYIRAENTRQYNQAEGTPFGSGLLREQIGLDATSTTAQDILNESYVPDPSTNLLEETKDIISTLGKPLHITTSHPKSKISAADFIATYKVVKEATSSSPSG